MLLPELCHIKDLQIVHRNDARIHGKSPSCQGERRSCAPCCQVAGAGYHAGYRLGVQFLGGAGLRAASFGNELPFERGFAREVCVTI